MGAIRVRGGMCTEKLSLLIRQAKPLPDRIKQLTSITDEMLAKGLPLDKGLQTFLDFIGDDTLIGYN
ncbi:MAG: 3'-5' exonuclease, partial [Butyricicoccus sp.]|nr:3'-5' exonuclease [Butyricicoccus sp.]